MIDECHPKTLTFQRNWPDARMVPSEQNRDALGLFRRKRPALGWGKLSKLTIGGCIASFEHGKVCRLTGERDCGNGHSRLSHDGF